MIGTLPPLILTSILSTSTPVVETPNHPIESSVQVQSELHAIQEQLIDRTNSVRTQYGIPPLAVDPQLVQSAERHTAWMANRYSLQHSTDPVAENIALGQQSVAEVMQSWMSSPGHRANILSSRYHRIGVAAYRATDGSIYWCQQFAP